MKVRYLLFVLLLAMPALAQILRPAIDPCQNGAAPKTYVSVSVTSNTQLVTGTTGKKVYICSVNLLAAAATNVAIVEGTGSTCGTGTAGVPGLGGATAATGWNFAANGGIVIGNGGFSVAGETTAGDNVCILVSASNQISGGLSFATQ